MKFSLRKKKSGKSHAFRYGKHLQPSRDWLVLLILWLVLFVVSIGYNVWLFARVTNGEPLEPGTEVREPRQLNLDATNQVFDAREAERARYLETYQFADPSR
jgi:hypothetical protein